MRLGHPYIVYVMKHRNQERELAQPEKNTMHKTQ